MIQPIQIVENVSGIIYSYGATQNNVHVSLGIHFSKWLPERTLQSYSILHNETQSIIINWVNPSK